MKRNYTNPLADERYLALAEDPCHLPFSFKYGGITYEGFSQKHVTLLSRNVTDAAGKQTVTFNYRLDDTLCVSLILTHYFSHGVTEWTVWFENTGEKNSKCLENISSCLTFEGKYPTLKGILGDYVNQYRPYSVDLDESLITFSSDSGRATHINFPYFNLEYGDGGAMLALGWAGTWQAQFSANDGKTTCRLSAVNNLCTYLRPNEKIRSALFVVAPYTKRSEQYAANFWRDWFVKHNLPRANAKNEPLTPFSTCCLAADTGLPNSDGSISERYYTWRPSLEKMISEDVKVDFRWFDAGWYVRPNGESEEVDWWGSVGTWEPDPRKWPDGTLLESTDFARANGMKTLAWFEPERVTDVDSLVKNYGYKKEWAIQLPMAATISNNIGNHDCLDWTVGRITKMLKENKIEMYREDNNCNASALWQYLDGAEGDCRRGITECKFIAGHYEMWDRIIECTLSIGGCGFVDSCASGGGRNDLESMRRGVPLLRSDSDRTTTSLRLSMSWGFNKWIPFCGASTKESTEQLGNGRSDTYIWRASYLPALNVASQFVHNPCQDFSVLRFGIKEWQELSPYLLKEFYTLTPWHSANDKSSFTAFAYFDPECEEGLLLAFRQEDCVLHELCINLPFTEGNVYTLTDIDSGERLYTTGELKLHFAKPRTARLLKIKK